MEMLWQDLRYGFRMLWKTPGFTAAAVLTLALGMGANTAVFSVVNVVLLRALPYKDADRLVVVWEHNRPRNRLQGVVNPANFMDWREQNSVFEDMAAFVDGLLVMTGEGEPEEIPSQLATPNFFNLLGVEAILGRTFSPDDGKPDSPRVVVISHGLWQRRFGGDPRIIGRKLMLSRGEATVIGVMPAGFRWFIKQGSLTSKPAELWAPLVITNEQRVRRGRYLTTVARLKPGVTLQQARAEMNTIAGRLEQQYREFNAGWGANVVPLREQFTGQIRPALSILFGAVGFLLLIVCANVANLLLTRATARQKEVAVRTVLGASRFSLVRQLLSESLLLALLGGAAGLVLAWWGVGALISLGPPDLRDLPKISISLPVLGFTLGVSMLTAVIFGLLPALEVSRLNTAEALKEESSSVAGSKRSRRVRDILIVSEVALALVLLIGAGLMVRSFARLQAVDPGFNAKNVLTMRVLLSPRKYPEDQQRMQFFKQAIERIQALPGVEAAGAVNFLPFAGPPAGTSFTIEGRPKPPAGQDLVTGVAVTDANYFRAMRIPLKRGRSFTEQEAAEARRVVIINEALARKYFPHEDPLGKRLVIEMRNPNPPTEIIGVVGNVKHMGLDTETEPMSFWPQPELVYPFMTLVIRTPGDAANIAAAARQVIHGLDPEQPVSEVRTLENLLAISVARARFNMLLLAIFALMALILAAVGIYGVLSYTVTQRTHEIGIRMALGAQTGDVLRLVVGQGMVLALIGVGIGLAGAFALTRLMSSLLYGVSATDRMTFMGISLLLAAIALLASYIPARRATKVDPMVALRYE